MSIQLKIKSKSLAAEARIIRSEERRLLDRGRHLAKRQKPHDRIYSDISLLHIHRVNNVRDAARATFLARAFMKGNSRAIVEQRPLSFGNMRESRVVAKAYGMVKMYRSAENPSSWMEFSKWATKV